MNIRELIDLGREKTGGNAAELARRLGIQPTNLAKIKRGECGLPSYACIRLGMLLEIDPLKVIAASELVTETNPERQELWKKYAD